MEWKGNTAVKPMTHIIFNFLIHPQKAAVTIMYLINWLIISFGKLIFILF